MLSTTWPLTSGDPISLDVCNSNWDASGLRVRVDHNVVALPSSKGSEKLVTYEIGGTGAAVYVRGPWSPGYPAYLADDPAEWVFDIVKSAGGPISSGDTVSLRINSNRGKTFFFRTTGGQDQAEIDGDGTALGQAGTLFIVEFSEVRSGLGWRPPVVGPCQACATVTGTVTDNATTQPIANAKVQALDVLEDHQFDATTGANGRFTLVDPEGRSCVASGTIKLRASADRYQTKTIAGVVVPGSGNVDTPIRLDCTQVRGKVVDTSGLPVVGALVFLLDSAGNPVLDPSGSPYMATTAPDGSFVFDCVPHVTVDLWTDADPSQKLRKTVPPEGLANVTIVVQTTCGNLVGRVTDADTGLPIAGATVKVVGTTLQATTDANGNFTFTCVKPSGPKTLVATATGYGAGTASGTVPTSGNSSPVNIKLKKIAATQIVIRLDWGAQPSDLDAHLSGPDGQGGRFHLYYDNRQRPPVAFASLDVDDITAFGPENITIQKTAAGVFVAGEYHYWVHNFNQTTFLGSGAVVTVLANASQLGRFEVLNAQGTQSDDIWRVVDLTIDANGNVVLAVRQTLQQGGLSTVL